MDLSMNPIKVRPNVDCWVSFTMMKFNAGRERFMPKKNWRWGLGQELKKTAHISFRMPESHWGPVVGEASHCSALVNCAVSAQRADTISDVNEFCEALGGKRPIHSILVANNGMAAVKFMRSIRTWAYETFGNEKAILLVAMATPEDIKINAEYIRIADRFVEVPGGTNNNNFANVQLIVEVAETTGVSAVWPGWGHASENPELPDALNEKGIIFLGPTAVSMAALGDKIGSSLIAQAAGVPTLPWSGSHIKIPAESCLEAIPEDIYRQACVHTTEEALESCQTVGYPAMIKASWGGGGKGIRKIHDDDEVKAFFEQVQAEVPGSPIFIMKVASQSRHLEVQLLCDQHGNVAALHSRDCSVQRRHQKIIEEGPITIAPKKTVKELEEAARRLAKCVNYVGAATVEYLYDMETGEYYFLELNPRLQVEHPVTESIAEVNLPAAQVAVGMGIPLWKIPEIRRFYGKNNGGGYDAWKRTLTPDGPFDFDKVESITPRGHCIAVRITSEDPDDGFKPTSGKVQELHFKSKPNVWAYFSVKSEGGIHEFSDSQFGHVFAFGDSRASAIANMVLGLKEIQIRGEIRTNVEYIIDLLNALDYRDNKIHTGWLDSRIAMKVKAERPPWYLSVVAGALYKASTTGAAIVKNYTRYLRNGQIPPKNIPLVHSQVQLNIEDSKYKIDVARGGVGSYKVKMNDSEIEAEIHTLSDRGLLMQLDGNSHVIYAEEEAAGTRLLIDGRTCLLQNDYDPSKLVADSPCKLLRFLVSDGSHVDEDTPYAEVEVMKMCRPLVLPASGCIHFVSAEGQQLQAGQILARVDLDDPSATKKSELFHGPFPALGPPTAVSCKINQRCAASVKDAQMILAGYDHNIDEVVRDLVNCLDNPQLAFFQWQASMSVLATRLPVDLRNELDVKWKEHEFIGEFPAKILRDVLEGHLVSCSERERSTQKRLVEPLLSLVKSHEGGRENYAQIIARSLFDDYLSVEELFDNKTQADVIENLRLKYENDLLKVVDMVLSHQGVRSKNKLILRLMEALVYKNPAPYRDQLYRFSALNHTIYSKLALKASKLLEQTKLSELGASIAKSLSGIEMSTEEGETNWSASALEWRMENLVGVPLAVEDVLVSLFDHGDPVLQRRIVETYIRRLYEPYLVKGSLRMQWHGSSLIASWVFSKQRPLTEPVSGKHFQRGFIVVSKYLEHLPNAIDVSLKEAVYHSTSKEHASHGSILHIALIGMNHQMSLLHDSSDEDQAQETVSQLEKILKNKEVRNSLQSASVREVSFIIQKEEGLSPIRLNYHISSDKSFFQEEPLLRHLEPPMSTFLELGKLGAFKNIKYSSSQDRQWHLYSVVDKDLFQRTFLRILVRQPNTSEGLSVVYPGVEADGNNSHLDLPFTSLSILRSVTSGLKELELHVHNASRKSEHNHMYLCVLREQQIDDLMQNARVTDTNGGEEFVSSVLSEVAHQIHELVGVRMHQLAVCEWEVKLLLTSVGSASGAWRIVVDNLTDQTCAIQVYREVNDIDNREVVYFSPFATKGPLHGKPLSAQYEPFNKVDKKRWLARKSNTTYCYDFPLAFETALKKIWEAHKPKCSKIEGKDLLKVNELIFSDKEGRWGTPLVAVDRPSASNDVGMVAWSMEMRTPEFPGGRSIFVVANDVTFKAGSFGQREDAFFHEVAKLACEKKLPLIYLAANSGARIGVAEEVKSCFRIGWSDELNPEQGFQYLYMTPEDHDRIGSSVISHELKLQNGEVRWVIDTIVGEEDGLGVENLTGSGAIASAFSRAYKETFTLTYVTGRTVGIGAYLARLGMRCIQRQDQPIILTGFSALNKLLGREVYSSNLQLGGPKIMAANGVVHLTVSDDLEGVTSILNWLSYVPSQVGGHLPILPPFDSPERSVEYIPENCCDPHAAISGVVDNCGKWCGGIFDKDSFVETLDGWAKTVVTGRAKLGGIPVGVIAVETQTVMQVIPADPGQSDSHERIVPQPGQVWFPDSASKTSQALSDFNQEELPLFILANWRGFSGGQRDLFEGILQAGSMIVENLRNYKQPVFVYIPMMGELRGGAWVVVDSRINPDHIEMYAENTAKGNVLEPQGMIEIKFRRKEILECMGRLDKQLIALKTNLEAARDSGDSSFVETLLQSILAREKQLLPIYTQIATSFAELHDTSYRMAAKGVIKEVVNWSSSRFFFYKRLRRRIQEGWMVKAVQHAAGEWLSYQEAENLVQFWYFQSGNNNWEDDESFYSWNNDPKNYEERLKELRMLEAERQVMKLGESPLGLQALPRGLANLLSEVEPSIREKLLEEIKQELGFANDSKESYNNNYTYEILM